jgi:hypothetical protein
MSLRGLAAPGDGTARYRFTPSTLAELRDSNLQDLGI